MVSTEQLPLEQHDVAAEEDVPARVHHLTVYLPNLLDREGVVGYVERVDASPVLLLAEVEECGDVRIGTDVRRMRADDPLARDLLDLPKQRALRVRMQVRLRLLDRQERMDGLRVPLTMTPA